MTRQKNIENNLQIIDLISYLCNNKNLKIKIEMKNFKTLNTLERENSSGKTENSSPTNKRSTLDHVSQQYEIKYAHNLCKLTREHVEESQGAKECFGQSYIMYSIAYLLMLNGVSSNTVKLYDFLIAIVR